MINDNKHIASRKDTQKSFNIFSCNQIFTIESGVSLRLLLSLKITGGVDDIRLLINDRIET